MVSTLQEMLLVIFSDGGMVLSVTHTLRPHSLRFSNGLIEPCSQFIHVAMSTLG